MLVQNISTEKEYALKIIPCKHEDMINSYEEEYLALKDMSSEYIIKLIDHQIIKAKKPKIAIKSHKGKRKLKNKSHDTIYMLL